MSKVSNALPLTIPLNIPAYWTPEQAFAVFWPAKHRATPPLFARLSSGR